MTDARKLLLSIAAEALKKQQRGERADFTPEVIAGFLIEQAGANAESFAQRVLELVVDSADVPTPIESKPVRKRGPLRLVK